MKGGMSTGLGTGVEPFAHERAEDEKTTRDQAERWATLLGAELASVRVPAPSASSVREPTSGWRAGAGDMTPGGANAMPASSAPAGVSGGSGEATADCQNRMIVRVDGGDLGEVALCVDRSAGAIRVTIGARDAAAEVALGSERVLLLQALESHGITVDSVRVVRGSNFGMLPAPRSVATRRAHESAEAEQTDDERARRRLARKLNLIG